LSDLFGRVSTALRGFLGLRPRLVRVELLGRSLVVTDGTIREKTDYDDAWFLACAARARVIFDVGANRGDMALLALLCPDVSDLVLIEPNADALVIATENIVRNRLSERVRFVCAFASDSGGSTARLWTVGSGAAGSMYSTHANTAARAGAYIEVPTVTLDELALAYSLLPDLVKIDVEGAEGLVLLGAKRCATNHCTRFLVEMHSSPELPMASNAAKVLGWCNELGYSAWYLARGSRLDSPNEIRDRGRCHLLLQPADWPYPSWLVGIPQMAGLSEVVIESGRTATN
jgi:FkbM family methyltransferase